MNKKNNKGFLLSESLIVSTFVLTVLIFLFTQFKNVIVSQKRSYTYNNVEDIYNLGSMNDFLSINNIGLVQSGYLFQNNSCTSVIADETMRNKCTILASKMDVNYIIYTYSDLAAAKAYFTEINAGQDLIDFASKVTDPQINYKGRLFAKFNNGNFATIVIDKKTSDNHPINDIAGVTKTKGNDNGLYADPVETGKYTYRGYNPNNYLKIGDEMWRIISIESDGALKIILSVASSPNVQFDYGINKGTENFSTILTTKTRYSSNSADFCYVNISTDGSAAYQGCKVWGNKNTMLDASGNHITKMKRKVADADTTTYNLPNYESYANSYLNGGTHPANTRTKSWYDEWAEKHPIESAYVLSNHSWNVGNLAYNSGQTLATDISQEKIYTWVGRVGLINPSEFVRASTNSKCGTLAKYYDTEATDCYQTDYNYNYLQNEYVHNNTTNQDEYKIINKSQRTISPTSANSYSYWRTYYTTDEANISKNYRLISSSAYAHTSSGYITRPVLYISPDADISGKGTYTNPYVIA